jgi:hypothetical protein
MRKQISSASKNSKVDVASKRIRAISARYSMDHIIFTPRLKLTLITNAERGSPELEWLHELYSDEKATWWRYERPSYSPDKFTMDCPHFSDTLVSK